MSMHSICGVNGCAEENKKHIQRKTLMKKPIHMHGNSDSPHMHGNTCANLGQTLRLACVLRDFLA